MGKRIDYFLKEQIAPIDKDCVLVQVNARIIPMVIGRIETGKGSGFWATDDDAERGYELLSEFQWSLLMDCTEYIVNNIIALRGIDPLAERDAATGVPIGNVVGSTLVDIWASLNQNGQSAGELLEALLVEQEATTDAVTDGLTDGNGDFLLSLILAAL